MDLVVGDRCSSASGRQVLAEGLRALYERSELCDVILIAGGERLAAHSVVLAAESDNFRQFLLRRNGKLTDGEDPMKGVLSVFAPKIEVAPQAPEPATSAEPEKPAEGTVPAETAAVSETVEVKTEEPKKEEEKAPEPVVEEPKIAGPLELEVHGVSSAEAVKLMLSYAYFACMGATWEYQPESSEVNKDVLRLSRSFGLQFLHEHAARWLVHGLTTANVVSRLVTCEEFGLGLLREKIVERLTENPGLLMMVSGSPEIMQHPRILQDLLVQVATLHERPRKTKAAVSSEPSVKAESPKPEEKEEVKVKQEKQEEAKESKQEKGGAEKPPAKRAKRVAGA